MSYTLGFIGCGNMGGALVRSAVKTVGGENIAVCDHDKKKTQTLVSECGVWSVDIREIATSCKFVVLGVKPQNIEETLGGIKEQLKANAGVVVVSMAAGVSTRAIRSYIGADLPVIRIMPNTPVAVGEGMILYALAGVNLFVENEFLSLFSGAGKFDKLSEDKIDSGSALSGCSPAFVYAFAEALADGGVECGLSREQASLYAAQTLRGAAEMLLTYGHPAPLKDAVCSPGGTTIAGMHALEKAGFRGAVMDAVTTAYKRTLELKK
ncbi:MAG: pyrroline-5-carboxylate reductase [Clostridia bacterium]|nr:pyrroline-5-carboxylate reductase [Clostridia bacterium]